MRLYRRPTRWLSSCIAVMLLCMQLAIAAYACPAVAEAAQAAAAMAGMPGCDGHMPGSMDHGQPQLCQAHCQQGSQTVHPTPTQDVPANPVLLAVLDWSMAGALPTQVVGNPPLVNAGAPPPGSPPLYLALLVLRN